MTKTIEERIEELLEYQEAEIEKLHVYLEDLRKHTPRKLEKVSRLSGIPQEDVLRLCAITANNYSNKMWSDILDIMDTFFTCKKTFIDKKEE